MYLLSTEDVIKIHDSVIDDNELQGLAPDKSLDSVLARVTNRLNYGMISSPVELAACYACYIARGHCFNDANKRTANTVMYVVLTANGIKFFKHDPVTIGNFIIRASQGLIEDGQLTEYLLAVTTPPDLDLDELIQQIE